MRNIVLLLVVSFGFFGLAQNDVLNEDGTISVSYTHLTLPTIYSV